MKIVKGQYSLAYKKGNSIEYLPLFTEDGKIIGDSAYLSTIDDMTMQFLNKNKLLFKYIELGVLKRDNLPADIYVISRKAKRLNDQRRGTPYYDPYKKIEMNVAYADDAVLRILCTPDSGKIAKSNPVFQRFVDYLLIDYANNKEGYADFIKNPPRASESFIDERLTQKLDEYRKHNLMSKARDNSNSEQVTLEENKRRSKEMITDYLASSYKRTRGLYYSYKSFKAFYKETSLKMDLLEQVASEVVRELSGESRDGYFSHRTFTEEEQADPYFIKDEFDRPEDEVEGIMENPIFQSVDGTPSSKKGIEGVIIFPLLQETAMLQRKNQSSPNKSVEIDQLTFDDCSVGEKSGHHR